MRCRAAGWLAGLALTWGGLVASPAALAQAPAALRQPIRLTPGRHPLGAVLAEVSRQSKLPLSYSSSLVPLAHPYQVQPGPARPLGEVLHEVLAAKHLQYSVLAGQLVVWPTPANTPAGYAPVGPTSASRHLVGSAATQQLNAPLPSREVAALHGPPAASTAGRRAAPPPAAILGARPASVGATSRPQLPSVSRNLSSQPAQPRRQAAISHAPASLAGALVAGTASRRAAATAATRQGPRAALPAKGPLNRLTVAPLPPRLAAVPAAPQLLPATLPTVSLPAAARMADPTNAAASRPSLGRLYLHGEAWLSEGLPIGLTGKVGLQRAYLVLGVAAGPFERPAWGLGLGTAGRPRGRFTPSLEAMNWFVRGENREPISLTQLRPQLAWQLKRQGRLALVAGPTLNLATTDDQGPPRGGAGQRQWPWFDNDGGRRRARFWPGLQVGIRL